MQSSSMTGSVFVESAWMGVSMHLLHQMVNCGGTTHSESILFWSVQCTKLPNVHEALHVLIGAKMMQIGLREPHAHGTRTGRLECIGIHLYSNSWTCSLHHTWHTYGCSDRSKQKRLHLQLLKFESPHHLNQKPS